MAPIKTKRKPTTKTSSGTRKKPDENKFYCGECQRAYSNACSLGFHIRTQHNNIVPVGSIMRGHPWTLDVINSRSKNGKIGKKRQYRFPEEVRDD